MKAIGLMSGTSLDGLDIALCDIEGTYLSTKVKLLAYEEKKLPQELKDKIQDACSIEHSNTPLICSLNFEIGRWIGDAVSSFLKQKNIAADEISYIASHGQTIFHIPHDQGQYVRSTLQIGEPAEIAFRTGIQVISNFRTMDIAAGGEGAPLVPYADYLLYRTNDTDRVLCNIGGIANITYLSAGCSEDEVTAFDTGPGNMMIDEAMRHFYQKEYDENGLTASTGKIDAQLMAELQKEPYIHLIPPKSTGRELFGRQRVYELLQKFKNVSAEDFVCTLTAYTAWSISENIKLYTKSRGFKEEVIISGGGAFNQYLMKCISQYLPESTVCTQEDLGYQSAAKEAVAFAILGNETLHGHYANMISATGAEQKMILGNITPRPWRNQF